MEKKMKNCVSCGAQFQERRFPVNEAHAVKCASCFDREDCEPMKGRW